MKTSELTDTALDWAIDIALGNIRPDGGLYAGQQGRAKHYSTDWSHGGPIIEREKIDTAYENGQWFAYESEGDCCDPSVGPTPLIAVMRCFVASKLGDKVELPEELQ